MEFAAFHVQTVWDAEAAGRHVSVCTNASLDTTTRTNAFIELLRMRLQCHLSNQRRDLACLCRLKQAIKTLRGEPVAVQSSWRTLFMRGDRETQSDFETRKDQCNEALIAVAPLIGWHVELAVSE